MLLLLLLLHLLSHYHPHFQWRAGGRGEGCGKEQGFFNVVSEVGDLGAVVQGFDHTVVLHVDRADGGRGEEA